MAKRILIADDAAFMRMMLKDILTKGYVMPYQASSFIVLSVLFLICLIVLKCTIFATPPFCSYSFSRHSAV